jgi:CubicO group peptidase (beta-lactamase class C family)
MKSVTCAAALAVGLIAVGATGVGIALGGGAGEPISTERIDRDATQMMVKAQGLAMAVFDDGTVVFVRRRGRRNIEKNLPL